MLLALLAATLASAVVAGAGTTNQNKGGTAMLKAVVHVNFADPERHEDALESIAVRGYALKTCDQLTKKTY